MLAEFRSVAEWSGPVTRTRYRTIWLSYIGTVLSIWGFFAAVRFPHADWVVLPALETVYYVVGT